MCMSEQGFVAKRGTCLLTFCKLNHPLVMCVDSVWRLCRSGSGSTVRGDGWGEFPACLVTYRHVLYYKAVTYSTLSLNHPLVMCVDSVWRLCRSGSGSTVWGDGWGEFPACLVTYRHVLYYKAVTYSTLSLNHPLVMCVDSVWRLCRSGSDSTVRGDGWGEFPACLVTYRHVLYYKAVTYSTLSLNHPLVMCVDSVWRLCRSGSDSAVRGDGWGEFPACLVTYRHVLYYKAVTYSTLTLSLNHPLVMCVDSVWRLCRSGSDSTVLRGGSSLHVL